MDGRDKPDHDGSAVFMGSGLFATRSPGKTESRNEKPRKLALPGQVPGRDHGQGEEPYQPARTEPLKRSATKALISGV